MSWELASTAVLALVLVLGFAWYERRKPPARIVALVAALAALAVVGRLAFAAVPNVKPTTDIVLFAGFALGAVPGFAVGAITALVSNIFLGQGPWTAWQMVGWGGVGVAGAGLAKAYGDREIGRWPLAIACGVAGLAFGALLDLYQTTLAARQDLETYLAVSATSLPYNLAHALGNVVFCLLIGPAFIRALRRYRRRFEVRWRPAVVVAGVMVLALAGTASASPASKATKYLERVQNKDGGFGATKGRRSTELFTGWSALGLASARRNPRDVARDGGRSIIRYMRGTRAISDLGELQRTILVLKTAGISPRSYRGRNLVADLLRRQSGDGSWRSNIALTTFGVLALRAGGQARGAGSVQRGGRLRGARPELRRRLRPRAGLPVRRGRDRRRAADARRRRPGRRDGRAQGHRVAARRAQLRRRVRAERGQAVERSVHLLGRAGPGGRAGGRGPRAGALPRRPSAPRWTHPLLGHKRPDAGVGHRSGAHRAAPQAVPARHRATQEAARRKTKAKAKAAAAKREQATKAAAAAEAEAEPGTRRPRRQDRPRHEEVVDVKPAARENEPDDGISVPLLIGAAAGAVGLVLLARRRLRRRAV